MGSHFFEEGWVISQVLGHHIEAENMAINAFASHGHSIEVLVLFCCNLQKSQPFLSLNEELEKKNVFVFLYWQNIKLLIIFSVSYIDYTVIMYS